MTQLYNTLGFISFWIIVLVIVLIAVKLFIKWNQSKGTIAYQIYDYLLFLVRYKSMDQECKEFFYKTLKPRSKNFKKKIFYQRVMDRLERDM